jgi:hypothetical protein
MIVENLLPDPLKRPDHYVGETTGKFYALRAGQTAAQFFAEPEGVFPPIDLAEIDKALFKISFNHENRLRVLESKAPLTVVQFKDILRALLA